MTRRLVLRITLGFTCLLAAGCATGGGRPLAPPSGTDQLRVARLRYEQKDYTEAVELLKGYIQYQSGASDLDEAHFLLGMTYTQQREWPLATGEFLIVTSEFPETPRLADAHYWLAISYWKQTRGAPYDQDLTRRAIAQMERFLALYPDHPKVEEIKTLRLQGRSRLAEKAVRNGELYIKLRQWAPARYYFELVRRDYPESHWAQDALAGQAESMYALGLLDDARTLIEENLPSVTDKEVRHRCEDVLKKVGPARTVEAPR